MHVIISESTFTAVDGPLSVCLSEWGQKVFLGWRFGWRLQKGLQAPLQTGAGDQTLKLRLLWRLRWRQYGAWRKDTQETNDLLSLKNSNQADTCTKALTLLSHMPDLSLPLILPVKWQRVSWVSWKVIQEWGGGRFGSEPRTRVCSEEHLCTQVIWTALWGGDKRLPLCPLVMGRLGRRGDGWDPPRFLLRASSPSISQRFYTDNKPDTNAAFYPHKSDHWNWFGRPNWSNLTLQISWYACKLRPWRDLKNWSGFH